MESANLDTVVQEARAMPLVPTEGAKAYGSLVSVITREVDEALSERSDITELIGGNPLKLMYDNHKHHGAFMATVFSVGSYELLAKTVPWVYRAYNAHGFSYAYFPVELKAWQKAVFRHVGEELSREILAVYEWMIAKHDEMIQLAETPGEELPLAPNWLEAKTQFLEALLAGEHKRCKDLSKSYVNDVKSVQAFYMHIVQPVMYEIGLMWERAEISVAQEHLASAIVSRVISGMAVLNVGDAQSKGKAIVTAAQGEFHELGAWMISDVLEQEGWKVQYLGANTPVEDLLAHLDDYLPDILAVSVTMPFNIREVKFLISRIREKTIHNSMKILVGGRVFADIPGLAAEIGADGCGSNIDETIWVVREWARQP